MPRDSIQSDLNQLRAEVDQSPLLSDEDRASLSDVADQLDALLAQDTITPAQALLDMLELKLFAYEERHPVVARIIDNVIVTLNGMGI